MIKDGDNLMVVFKSFNTKRGGQGVYFYDVEAGKEIARAQSASLFVKHLPKGDDRESDKLSFFRLPALALKEMDSTEEMEGEMSTLMVLVMISCK